MKNIYLAKLNISKILVSSINLAITQSGLDKVVPMETILIRTINREKIELN